MTKKFSHFNIIFFGMLSLAGHNLFAANLVVHEWGTFTSAQDSRGVLLDGIYHEDEALPNFVYGREQFSKIKNSSKFLLACHGKPGCKRTEPTPVGTLLAANEKLETPVIYFYSKKPLTASIDVSFPGGIISQWFPNATTYSPPIDQIQTLSQGQMSWKVDILTDNSPTLPEVGADSIWAPSREVKSNPVRVGSETEKFIFYRGLGRFSVPVRITSSQTELVVSNPSPESISSAFVLEYTGESGSVLPLGQIDSHSDRSVKFSNLQKHRQTVSSYITQVSKNIENALIQSGLYPDEALALVHTWTKSYFKTKGLRVLYILPRQWTDTILPMQIQPKPNELVRTLVGRIEVLTAQEEQEISDNLKRNPSFKEWTAELGRFAEPKLRRVIETSKDPRIQNNGQSALNTLAVE